MSEYDPLFARGPTEVEDDLTPVRDLFRGASARYLRFPASWLAWACLLPAAAWVTSRALNRAGPAGALFTWSIAILAGGAVELAAIRRAGRGAGASALAAWVLRMQGNLSLVALLLSALLVWQDAAWALPGLWLLLLGHSFYILGGLSFAPFRAYGLLYQLGGVAALWPGGSPLFAFALTTGAANLWMAWSVWRERAGRGER